MSKLSTYALTTATAKQVGRLATANTGYLNIMDPPFNASGDPAVDDTAALIAVRDAALATAGPWGSKGIYQPPGAVVRFTAPVDFRGISTIKMDGYLLYAGAVTAPCLQFGCNSADGSTKYSFEGIYCLNEAYNTIRYPIAQFFGCRGSTVRIGTCNSFIEIAASPGAYYSTAYSEFHLGSVWRLEIRSPTLPANSTSGWINSNQFYGGSMAQLRMGGPWVFITSIVGTTVTTTTAHNFSTGMLVEMYNGTLDDGVFRLITVTDATHFELSSGFATSGNAGNGWRCMGPSGYPHNDNLFLCPNIEDNPAIVHIQGQFNRFLQARTEVGATSSLVFAPHVFGNMYEASNTAQGYEPQGDQFPMVVQDFNGGNYWGWTQPPQMWNATQGRQRVVVDATTVHLPTLKEENALISMTSSSANLVTVPTNASAPFGIGARIDVVQSGTGQTTFDPAGGVTVNPAATLKIDGQYTKVSLTKTATDTWLLSGKIKA